MGLPGAGERLTVGTLMNGFVTVAVGFLILGLGCLEAVGAAEAGGKVTTIAGTGVAGTAGDGGPARAAQLKDPFGVVRGPDGALWFCDYAAHLVRRIAPDGTLTTVAGTGEAGYSGDGGPGTKAQLNQPHEIRFGPDGQLYIADTSNHAVRKLDVRTGMITTIAGTGKQGYSGDGGPATAATFRQAISIQFGPGGDLYVVDIGNHVIRRIDRAGVITTYAGTGKAGPTPPDAPLAGTPLNGPRSLDFDAAGNLWLVTREGNQVLRLDRATSRILHVAGTGKKGFTGDDGPAALATFSGPKGIAVAPNGGVYLVDTENHAIRRIDPKSGVVQRVLGTGQRGDGPDGNPLQTRLARPHGIFVEADGTVLVGDSENHRLRSLSPQ